MAGMLIIIATNHKDGSDRSVVSKATMDTFADAITLMKSFGYQTVEVITDTNIGMNRKYVRSVRS